MKVLSIETSTMLGGIAVMDDKTGLVAEIRVNVKAAHSERLMIELDHLLVQSGITLPDLDAIAVSTGPGSFTGLRIGISTAKGLAFGTGLPVVPVPTLEAFAWNFPESSCPVCPMFDARKKEVYAGVFMHEDGEAKRLMEEISIAPSALARSLKAHAGVLFAGDGASIYRDVLIRELGEKARFAPPHLSVPTPSAVAFLGLRLAQRGMLKEAGSIRPFYIRKSEAELKSG